MATPIRAFSRYVAEDTEVDGVALPEGSRIIAIYASANRDTDQWDEPDVFDVTRTVAFTAAAAEHGVVFELPRFEETPEEVADRVDLVIASADDALDLLAAQDPDTVGFGEIFVAMDDALYPA